MITADLLAPLSVEDFLADHWPERAVALPPDPRRPAIFPTLSRLPIREFIAGYPGPVHAVGSDDTEGRLDRIHDGRGALTAFDRGVSLCLGGVHMVLPEVRAALDALVSTVGLSIGAAQCNAYVSPAGEGVPWHFDDREVLAVQLQGSKRWTLAPNREVLYPTMNFVLATGGPDPGDDLTRYGPARFAGPSPRDEHVHDMTPGAALFMPRGTWHRTAAAEPSLSLTFGLFTPTALDILLEQTRAWCLPDARYRQPLALGSPAQRALTQRRLEKLFAPWLSARDGEYAAMEQVPADTDPASPR